MTKPKRIAVVGSNKSLTEVELVKVTGGTGVIAGRPSGVDDGGLTLEEHGRRER